MEQTRFLMCHLISDSSLTAIHFSDPVNDSVMFCALVLFRSQCMVCGKHDSLDTWGQMKTQPQGNTLEIEPFVNIYMRQQHITGICIRRHSVKKTNL